MQLRIENKLHPIVKNKLLDLTHLPAQPYLRQYNENDLLTEIERPNPDWHEGDPEDERYIIEYVDEGYTGFLPVNLQIENPNFVQLWGKEDSEGEITFGSLPITENGKYKFWFNYEGFANGYIPVKRYDNNTSDYDYNINIKRVLNLNSLYYGWGNSEDLYIGSVSLLNFSSISENSITMDDAKVYIVLTNNLYNKNGECGIGFLNSASDVIIRNGSPNWEYVSQGLNPPNNGYFLFIFNGSDVIERDLIFIYRYNYTNATWDRVYFKLFNTIFQTQF